jgi:predicted ribosome quality control (RQC) complex YloA/Tae2 family protein
VASVNDPTKAWLDMVEQFQTAALGSNAPELWRMMFAPIQQQLDVMQKSLEAQEEFHRQLTEQALAPMRQVLESMEQAAKTTRAAGEALKEAGNLLTQQATAMDQALSFTSPILEITAPRKRRAKAK